MFAQATPPNPARLQRAKALRRMAREVQGKKSALARAAYAAKLQAEQEAKTVDVEPVVADAAEEFVTAPVIPGEPVTEPVVVRNKGGRPKGSKNRPKAGH